MRGASPRLSERAQAIHSAARRELGGPQPLDEVAATSPARLLHGAENRIERGPSPWHPFGVHRLSDQNAVAVEQTLGQRGLPLLGGRLAGEIAPHQRPASRRLRRGVRHPRAAQEHAGAPPPARGGACRSSPLPPRPDPRARSRVSRKNPPVAAWICGKKDAPRERSDARGSSRAPGPSGLAPPRGGRSRRHDPRDRGSPGRRCGPSGSRPTQTTAPDDVNSSSISGR